MNGAKRVFISYSNDTETTVRVKALADQLITEGIKVVIDLYGKPPQGWPEWMYAEIERADIVLVICTETYYKKIRSRQENGPGRGASWEINIIFNCLYSSKLTNDKFFPVIFGDDDLKYIPLPIAGFTHFNALADEGYIALYRLLTDQPSMTPPLAGNVRVLPKSTHEDNAAEQRYLHKLNKTMSNPRYSDDVNRLDRSWELTSVLNRQSTIIVVGTGMVSELLDRTTAEMLRDEIDKRGKPNAYRRGVIITDSGWYANEFLRDKPVIAIGGPKANTLVAEFNSWSPSPGSKNPKYEIKAPWLQVGFFRKNSAGRPQVGLWGDASATDTQQAVEHYINDAQGLTSFLRMIWK